MTFDEWKEQNLNRFTCSHEVFVAYEAWQQQQTRINELEKMCNGRDEIIEELQEKLKERQQKHLDSIRALRKANENVTKIAKDNLGLLSDIEALEAKLKVDAKKAWEAAFEEGYKFANKENEEYEKTLTGDSAV